ncbi:hypothetical protein EVAR_22563_1 [Eumeta japonica]|uniref:Uncharacterized protein n=1 Tax=Eumeta variegata TaxID=151549 RepID=A0A4C1U842_EUMVA|nr:hypothetical protein EVAR_22563_1 [Eumeta japonica]
MKPHVLSSNAKGASSKFVPKRDDPYLINKKVSPTTYLLAYPETLDEPIGKYHDSDLKRYHAREDACSEILEPVVPKRRRDLEIIAPRRLTSLAISNKPSTLAFGVIKGVALNVSCIKTLYCFDSDHFPVLLRMGPLTDGSPNPTIKITNWNRVSTALKE